MMTNVAKRVLIATLTAALFTIPVLVNAQTKPTLGRGAQRRIVRPLVPVGTNLKIRLDDTLSSKDSRVGDRFTATVLDPVRFNEAKVTRPH